MRHGVKERHFDSNRIAQVKAIRETMGESS
jgi:hypothetical protein